MQVEETWEEIKQLSNLEETLQLFRNMDPDFDKTKTSNNGDLIKNPGVEDNKPQTNSLQFKDLNPSQQRAVLLYYYYTHSNITTLDRLILRL